MPDDKTNPESAPTDESQKPQVIRHEYEYDIGPRAGGMISAPFRAAKATMIYAKEKLVGVVALGVGAVAPHFLRARTENASAAKMIGDATNSAMERFRNNETGGNESNAQIMMQAEQFQQKKRMANVQSIVRQSIEQMPEQVPDTPVDHDWAARFFDNAKDVSNEEMQKLWAKLLAGEVERPGSASLRTLSILREMTQKEAELFARAVNYIFSGTDATAWMFRANASVQALPDISVSELYSLIGAGLVIPHDSELCRWVTPNLDAYCHIIYAGKKILRLEAKRFSIPIYDFSISGTQLAKYIEPTVNAEYLQQVANYIHAETGHAVEVADVLALDFESGRFESGEFQKIAG